MRGPATIVCAMTWRRDILALLAEVNDRRRDDVSVPALSTLAHRSVSNLHRGFRAVVGETPKAYTSRVRLARAAADLVTTDRLTSAVAAEHGYASHEVFTRAFTRFFGVSPRSYRARGLHVRADSAVRAHAAAVSSVAPCVGLYRMTVIERSSPVPVDIAVQDMPAVHALVMRRRIARDEVAGALASMLPALFGHAQRHGLTMTGPPFARYPEIGMGSLVIEGGVTIAEPAPGSPDDGIEALTIPAGPAAVAIHHGPYDTLPNTYRAIEDWVGDQDRSPGGPPREIYLTDPGERPDPETWETQIVQPLA
jgi:AraC family transcriptional regulator